jgi:signal peptidase I
MDNEIKGIVKEWILPVVSAVVIALFINKFLFFMARIPSTSMYPTLKVGDRIFVTKVYNKGSLKRGDIVLFKSKELGSILVKRLIGLPGESVEVKVEGEGIVVYINGTRLDEPYVSSISKKGGTFQVPEDSYLFLGDNRKDSYDSRYWKSPYIYKDDIMGKARVILFPFNRAGILK